MRNDALKGPFAGKRAGVEFVDDETLSGIPGQS